MKECPEHRAAAAVPRFSAALCRGLIEGCIPGRSPRPPSWFSAALCRGLIEGPRGRRAIPRWPPGFPRLYAAASLKAGHVHPPPAAVEAVFSAALCRGLIEGLSVCEGQGRGVVFSAALCRGLIEGFASGRSCTPSGPGFPRLYAAASLKGRDDRGAVERDGGFSAALCRGLIEGICALNQSPRVPKVFRGFMPRPH